MENRSCLTKLLEEVTQSLGEVKRVDICCIDFGRAFDLVNPRVIVCLQA